VTGNTQVVTEEILNNTTDPSLVLLNTKPGSLNTPRLFEDHQPVGGTETEVDGV
jgi:hypothetical protein